MSDFLLYPINNARRLCVSLDGMWKFQLNPKGEGAASQWPQGLPDAVSVPVPSSFADLFTERKTRDYTGDFWYETEFYVPAGGWNGELFLRFGSLTHRAAVYVNGKELAFHEGGFLPVAVRVSDAVRRDAPNRLVVRLNNEVNETSLPCGSVKVREDGAKLA